MKSSLQYELYSNASFLCERLLAQTDNEEIRLLLAESYLGDGKAYKAYEVLKGCTSSANRYKLALTCLKLNKLAEAEKVLLDYPNIRSLTIMDSDQMKKVPYGAAGLYLLGQVRELQSKRKEAVKNYRKALELDPTLWCAYERLCVLEPGESAGSFFTEDHIYIQRMNSEIMREFEVYNDLSQH